MPESFKCPKCGNTTWGDLENCPRRGESLVVRCDQCGASWRYFYDYKYCPHCGAKVIGGKSPRE
jgi:predicted RNA-binding Zn-ribbon protein involved in translation (DUF1610 family)